MHAPAFVRQNLSHSRITRALQQAITVGRRPNHGSPTTLYRKHNPFGELENYEPGIGLLDDTDVDITAFQLMREVSEQTYRWISRSL